MIHPTVVYVWAVPGLCLLVAKKYRSFFILSGALVCSLLVGSVILWDSYNLMIMPFMHLAKAFFQDPLRSMHLVAEFHPTGGPWSELFVMAFILSIKVKNRTDLKKELERVDFLLVITLWILGLYTARFWIDWGVPALAVWFALQFKELLELTDSGFSKVHHTAIASGIASAILMFQVTLDTNGRYSESARVLLLTKPENEIQKLLPEPGGILYSTDMLAFYHLFYRFPSLPFKYATGFEAGLMPAEDLAILRKIQFNKGSIASFEPWFAKMTTKDRIGIKSDIKPEKEGFEFTPCYYFWIGRKLDNKR